MHQGRLPSFDDGDWMGCPCAIRRLSAWCTQITTGTQTRVWTPMEPMTSIMLVYYGHVC